MIDLDLRPAPLARDLTIGKLVLSRRGHTVYKEAELLTYNDEWLDMGILLNIAPWNHTCLCLNILTSNGRIGWILARIR